MTRTPFDWYASHGVPRAASIEVVTIPAENVAKALVPRGSALAETANSWLLRLSGHKRPLHLSFPCLRTTDVTMVL